MGRLLGAILYIGLAFGANAAAADVSAAKPLATGDMAKLVFEAAPKALPEVKLVDAEGAPKNLAPYKGKWMVLNFWATWCAPCREEMPTLQHLQEEMPDIAVVPVATGFGSAPDVVKRFYAQAKVTDLPVLRDPSMAFSRKMGVLGLPVTLIVNPDGQEVARLIGGAVWDSPDAQAVLKALTK